MIRLIKNGKKPLVHFKTSDHLKIKLLWHQLKMKYVNRVSSEPKENDEATPRSVNEVSNILLFLPLVMVRLNMFHSISFFSCGAQCLNNSCLCLCSSPCPPRLD